MSRPPLLPLLAALLGIALFSAMDAAMKGLSIALGAYVAMLWRQFFGVIVSAPFYLVGRAAWPDRVTMRLHLIRGGVAAAMAVLWFYGLARLPMAEAIAIAFVAPLFALYLAALLLGEKVSRASILASVLGLAGMGVLVAARIGLPGERHLDGVAAILCSAMLYAWNLILMRQQSRRAGPAEVAFFQALVAGSWLLAVLPLALLAMPGLDLAPTIGQAWLLLVAALLASASLALLSWAYARAEAQALAPTEYSGVLWGALLGAIFYGERVTATTILGAGLIILGCLLLARPERPRHVSPQVEGAS